MTGNYKKVSGRRLHNIRRWERSPLAGEYFFYKRLEDNSLLLLNSSSHCNCIYFKVFINFRKNYKCN